MEQTTYKIMIAIGHPGYLYEIWGETKGLNGKWVFTHDGYFKTREEAEKILEKLQTNIRKLQND